MRIAIAGGHGKIALASPACSPSAATRSARSSAIPTHAGDVEAAGAEPVVCDLENAADEEVAAAVGDAEAVVFAAGAGPGSGPERKWTMDYGGAVKLINAAKAAGADRYVMVSSMGADADAPGDDTFAVYLRAKGKADDDLRASGLDYTIVRPGRLTDDPGTGRVALGRERSSAARSRATTSPRCWPRSCTPRTRSARRWISSPATCRSRRPSSAPGPRRPGGANSSG